MVMTIADVQEAEELLGDLEALQEALPTFIGVMKLAIAAGRQELRSEGLEHLVDAVDAPPEPVA